MENSEKINLAKSVLAEIKTTANIMAMTKNMGKATKITKGKKLEVISCIQFGYCKKSDGSYVSNAYRDHFGWKNTYYQPAECVVSVPDALWGKADKWEKFLAASPEVTEKIHSIFGGIINN